MNANTAHIPLADVIQIGEILYASGLFSGLANKEQSIARILRGQELGIPPVASLMDGGTLLSPTSTSPATAKKSNSQQISDLLNELGITDPTVRRAAATRHLKGRSAADLSPDELEAVLTRIRQERTQGAEDVEAIVVSDEDTEAAEEDEPTDARAAIAASAA
ncbi:MAG: hypothetical protein AAFQ89_09430 [Cyanobacteria bacterium J06626_18]